MVCYAKLEWLVDENSTIFQTTHFEDRKTAQQWFTVACCIVKNRQSTRLTRVSAWLFNFLKLRSPNKCFRRLFNILTLLCLSSRICPEKYILDICQSSFFSIFKVRTPPRPRNWPFTSQVQDLHATKQDKQVYSMKWMQHITQCSHRRSLVGSYCFPFGGTSN